MAFNEGLFAIFGLSEAINKIIVNMIAIILFLIASHYMFKERKIKIFSFGLLVLLVIVSLMSFLLNSVRLLHLVFFFKIFILPFLFFITLMNIPFLEIQREKILKFIMILFLIQIPAAVIKISLIGFQEDYMGTLSIEGGSLATVVPLIAISYIFSYVVYNPSKKKFLLLIPLFIFVAVSCSKLGIVPYLFILLILLYFFNEKNKIFNINTLLAVFKFSIVGFTVLYIFVTMTPRANPDNEVGGRVDLEYAIKFTETYTSRENKETKLIGVARKDAPLAVLNILSDKGIIHILFGMGPGDIIMSSFLPYHNPMIEKYHLGYGARTGFIWTMMQIGIIGSFIYLLFHILLFRRVFVRYKSNTNIEHKVMFLTTIGVSIVFFLDYFTYSPSLTTNQAMVYTYFYLFYYILKFNHEENYQEIIDKKY